MKIVVVGGSGLIGSKVVMMLTRDGHEVVAASRRSGVDGVTGEGLARALSGATVVVDVSNSPSFEDPAVMKFFKTSTHNLLTGVFAAGVRHQVALSVVGTGRLLQSGYLRAKFAQEKLIEESSIPYSIIQATQFFEFLKGIADAATHGNAVRVPPVLIQPIAADDVARAVAKIATGTPLNEGERIPHQRSAARVGLAGGRCGGVQRRGSVLRYAGQVYAPAGSMSEGTLDGSTVTCPLHGAQFNVWTGAVLRAPAKDPLKTYRVTIESDVGRVEVPLAQAVPGA
jgi:nitrite reductase/ring-hydroxylating ferredoxin subunit